MRENLEFAEIGNGRFEQEVGVVNGNLGFSGVNLGGQIGYSAQSGPLVIGVEADGDWVKFPSSTVTSDWSYENSPPMNDLNSFVVRLAPTSNDPLNPL